MDEGRVTRVCAVRRPREKRRKEKAEKEASMTGGNVTGHFHGWSKERKAQASPTLNAALDALLLLTIITALLEGQLVGSAATNLINTSCYSILLRQSRSYRLFDPGPHFYPFGHCLAPSIVSIPSAKRERRKEIFFKERINHEKTKQKKQK
ncbi:uncharacterized protein BO95DRAFT_132939 [Aspergillus brunneoviolaceus CBS 621.78]|uniref:Uncharacterized protein n=1 Tax=Aspergillus brunneoviolaceus CBS 621.78 TaxID=1450534 RepID=A0ACD1G946_9EURO|nr:hypothetical protein BO95DRAFT_132939 [Aspergillus brunneoviolaceus CBS 621.78]RAH45737.1 hypothetical protein BO95DRAFT_132939 [Aspergillus brunneoviolaceus CBS 621.78]